MHKMLVSALYLPHYFSICEIYRINCYKMANLSRLPSNILKCFLIKIDDGWWKMISVSEEAEATWLYWKWLREIVGLAVKWQIVNMPKIMITKTKPKWLCKNTCTKILCFLNLSMILTSWQVFFFNNNRKLGVCVEHLTFIFEKIIIIVIINTYDDLTWIIIYF